MTICRALNSAGDWTFGKGANNYLSGNAAIAQDIQTRLLSFLGDCPFDLTAGVDWFNLLGGKDQTALNLAITAVILNTNDVTGGVQVSVVYTPATRNLSISYQAQTIYSTLSQVVNTTLAA